MDKNLSAPNKRIRDRRRRVVTWSVIAGFFAIAAIFAASNIVVILALFDKGDVKLRGGEDIIKILESNSHLYEITAVTEHDNGEREIDYIAKETNAPVNVVCFENKIKSVSGSALIKNIDTSNTLTIIKTAENIVRPVVSGSDLLAIQTSVVKDVRSLSIENGSFSYNKDLGSTSVNLNINRDNPQSEMTAYFSMEYNED
ncbi:MAG: hypothetical protein FWH14_04480 [Oscillospiraceae bacterium]|nr:hypothetical protein [Oscillospiraceae bacterium]